MMPNISKEHVGHHSSLWFFDLPHCFVPYDGPEKGAVGG